MKYISSVHNDQIKHVINLQKKAYRYEHGQFIAEGTRSCTQLLESYNPVTIYMTEKYYMQHTLQQYEEIIICLADHVMDKISTSQQPSGICIIFSIPAALPLPQKGPGLMLIEVSDPGNLGTLLRTAAAMNIQEIILIGGTDPYGPKVIQSTAGCIASLKIHQTTLEQIKKLSLNLCALVVKNGKKPSQISFNSTFLVVGNEAHGLSLQEINLCQEKMTIPMPGNAESLNAAIAGAIGMYIMASANNN